MLEPVLRGAAVGQVMLEVAFQGLGEVLFDLELRPRSRAGRRRPRSRPDANLDPQQTTRVDQRLELALERPAGLPGRVAQGARVR